MFFRLSSWELALILVAIVFGATATGLVLGRFLRHRSEHLREPLFRCDDHHGRAAMVGAA